MMKSLYSNIFLLTLRLMALTLITGAGLASCSDDFGTDSPEIPDGVTEFTVEVDYKAFAGVDLEPFSRADNNADGRLMKQIKTLYVVAYTKDAAGEWALAPNFPLEITEAANGLKTQEVANTRPDNQPQAEETTWRANFKMRLSNGIYRLYAVANYDMSVIPTDDISSPEKLRALALTWDEITLANNSEMFGPLSADAAFVDGDPEVTIAPGCSLHAWLRRAASKITVAFDTSRLLDKIEIYLKSVTVRDIPLQCYLGQDNVPGSADRTISHQLIHDGPALYFGSGASSDDYRQWRKISRASGPWGVRSETEAAQAPAALADRLKWEHSEETDALYLYENMQGVSWKDKSQMVPSPENGWGWTDNLGYPNPVEGDPNTGWKDCMASGSYIEVEAFYVCNIPDREQSGPIKYRFMLGRDVKTDYNVDRNSHLKLTLMFNGMANDADWHIDYKEPVLTITEPKVFDYRGQVFIPDISISNWGNNFIPDNTVTVSSYEGSRELGLFKPFKVEYLDEGASDWSETSSWLSYTADKVNDVDTDLKFHATSVFREVDIDSLINAQDTKGETTRWNLSHPSGTANTIQETANTYIVSAKGYYILPLVYGNGWMGGSEYAASYTYSGSGSGRYYLKKFKNHLNNEISSPNIRSNTGCSDVKDAVIVWQDSPGLITNVAYDASAFGGKGGLKFDATGTLKQGNAVVAIRDRNDRVMWSWQIWVTSPDFTETIPVTAFKYAGTYNMMPVNLGWNSEGEKVRYYPRRKCKVRISTEFKSYEITIQQESHVAVPRGSCTYYQWGRKDPFIGTVANYKNKPRYTPGGNYGEWDSPKRMYDDWYNKVLNPGQYTGVERTTSRESLHLMILHPDVWFNPKRHEIGNDQYESVNETYDNLWCGTPAGNDGAHIKTIYDPSPIGFAIPNHLAFTGFTDGGNNITYTGNPSAANFVWHAEPDQIGAGCPTDGVYEFYTDERKVQSICFPQVGYRDWDAMAQVYWFGDISYCWENNKMPSVEIPANLPVDQWTADQKKARTHAYSFMFSRSQGYVYPYDHFFASDGFPVRACRYR